ncbi:MAG TPA: glycosyltransferase [Acidimicrobiia bacterium]|nr:glycosyltransferase [Acidimicrobiia bacterium]
MAARPDDPASERDPPSPIGTVLVIPAYNEERRLDLGAFDRYLAATHGIGLQFVDDGSTDGTSRMLEHIRSRHPDRVWVDAPGENQGKAAAVRLGVTSALLRSPEFVGYWDADLSTPFDEVEPMATILRERPEIDMVLGSRLRRLGSVVSRSAVKHYSGRLFATAASIALGLPVYDTQCGAKLFRTNSLIAEAFREPFTTTWAFDVELLARYISLARADDMVPTVRLYEYPLRTWIDRSGSKVRLFDRPRALWEVIRVGIALRRSRP